MATPKIVGIETEFGIMVRGTADWNPVSASSLLINAYVGTDVGGIDERAAPIAWDFIDEMPGADARDIMPPDFAMPPEVETHLVNAVLTNGARYYVDHAHPELSTPECRDAQSVVLFDRAAELILIDSMAAAAENLPDGQEIVIYKDNSDRKGNAYGCHENYLLDRGLPFGQIITAATTHFVTRQIFTGSGKVGSELPGLGRRDVPFQLTQRAEHFEEEVGLETTLKRPIVNTRDEPHADSQKYRRLHVIVGDANLAQVATLLKVGTSAILFAMLEDGAIEHLPIDDPVPAMHHVSHDLTLRAPIRLTDGRSITALDVQWDLLRQAKSWADRFGLEAVGGRLRQAGDRAVGGGPGRARAGSVVGGGPGRLGGQEADPRRLHGPPRLRLGRLTPQRPRSPVPRPAPRSLAGGTGRSGADRDRRRRPSRRPGASPRHPGLLPGQAASRSSPTTWWQPTGTRSCSTSATTRCVEFPCWSRLGVLSTT